MLGTEEKKVAAIIGELEQLRADAEQFRTQAGAQAVELERLKVENVALNQELRESKQRFIVHSEKVKTELERRIDELLVLTKQRLKKKAAQSARQHDEYVKAASKTAEVVRQQKEEAAETLDEALHELQIELADILTDEPVQVGDTVAVADSLVRGTVLQLDGRKGEAVLEVRGKRVQVRTKKLRKVVGAAKPAPDPLSSLRAGSENQAAPGGVVHPGLGGQQ